MNKGATPTYVKGMTPPKKSLIIGKYYLLTFSGGADEALQISKLLGQLRTS